MKKLVKFFAFFTLFLLVLVIAGGTLLGLFINPNDYKQQIEQAALDNANIELKINGDIAWSVYPQIGLSINTIEAAYPDKPALASLTTANVSVMLMPLFSGDVQVKDIIVEGLSLNLVQEKNSNNWQVSQPEAASQPAKSNSSNTSAADTPQTPEQKSSSFDLNKVTIASVTISDANVTYTDATTNKVSTISDLNLATGELSLGQPFNAELMFNTTLNEAGKQQLAGKVELSALFSLDFAKQHYKITDLASKLTLVTDKTIELALNTDINAKLAENSVAISNLEIRALNTLAKGTFELSGEQLSKVEGILTVDPFNLKALLKQLALAPIETAEPSALTSIAFKTQISGDFSKINLKQFLLTLDKTTIAGNASYTLDGGLIGFNLDGDNINLSDYLPAPAQASNAKPSTSAKKSPAANTSSSQQQTAYSKETIIELEPLRSLNLLGKLKFSQLHYQKAKIQNLTADITAQNGLVKVSNLNMQTYSGQLQNSITLDARNKTLKLSIASDIKQIQLGNALSDFAQTDLLTGLLSVNTNVSASGQSVHSIVNSLNGNVKFNLADGEINGINAAHEMCQTINSVASLGGTISETQSVDKSTSFANIQGLLNIKNGVISNNDFIASLDALNAAGKGSVNLPQQTLNYQIGLKIEENLFNKSCSVNNKIQDIEWPVLCQGGFNDDPLTLCKPDTSALKDLAKKALEKELKKKLEKELEAKLKDKENELKQKLEEKIGSEAKDKLKDALKGLF